MKDLLQCRRKESRKSTISHPVGMANHKLANVEGSLPFFVNVKYFCTRNRIAFGENIALLGTTFIYRCICMTSHTNFGLVELKCSAENSNKGKRFYKHNSEITVFNVKRSSPDDDGSNNPIFVPIHVKITIFTYNQPAILDCCQGTEIGRVRIHCNLVERP